ncbi:hypothetical protein FRX31_002006 [Thalictrum thalictroides]|uniref:Uncharacterized protein n=1 Tax=Thalictrum thalictroides TaxID=46969 RepID=A0A7J6XGW9_THATH|nr:hypothetical protein FRX31_002006 [Thalictrum thalictroides]
MVNQKQRNVEEPSCSKQSDPPSNLELVTEPQSYFHRPNLFVFAGVYRVPFKINLSHYMKAVKGVEHKVNPSEICVTLGHIRSGLRFPLSQLDREVLNFYFIGNFWRFMYCFNKMKEVGYDVTLEEIWKFAKVTSTANKTPRY